MGVNTEPIVRPVSSLLPFTDAHQRCAKMLPRPFVSGVSADDEFLLLPGPGRSRWDQGLVAAEMKRWHWVKPVIVCQIKFTEWTRNDRLRQPVFLGIRDDKNADSREGELHWFAVRELVSLIASPRSYAFVLPFRVIAVCGFCIIHSQVKKRFVAGSDRDGFHGREPPS